MNINWRLRKNRKYEPAGRLYGTISYHPSTIPSALTNDNTIEHYPVYEKNYAAAIISVG